jgi:hypothetical protein
VLQNIALVVVLSYRSDLLAADDIYQREARIWNQDSWPIHLWKVILIAMMSLLRIHKGLRLWSLMNVL